MELVEDDQPHPCQRRVPLEHARQDAFGHHLDAGVRPDPRVQAHAVADRPPDRLPAQLRHAHGGRTRGQAPRLQHEDAPAREPRLAQQGRGHARGLARARRGLQHRRRPGAQRRGQIGQHVLDREAVCGGRRPGVAQGVTSSSKAGVRGSGCRGSDGVPLSRIPRASGESICFSLPTSPPQAFFPGGPNTQPPNTKHNTPNTNHRAPSPSCFSVQLHLARTLH